jgi:uncharacterized membrane protein YgcG
MGPLDDEFVDDVRNRVKEQKAKRKMDAILSAATRWLGGDYTAPAFTLDMELHGAAMAASLLLTQTRTLCVCGGYGSSTGPASGSGSSGIRSSSGGDGGGGGGSSIRSISRYTQQHTQQHLQRAAG